ncbi:MAG: hypothetical protein LBP59_10065 [Planctomycetaceae bacterium]|nr:hypothetical protein [Planctomycetaceae bacterium]
MQTIRWVILLVLEIQRFKSVKACRPKARQAKVNANSSTNSLKPIAILECPNWAKKLNSEFRITPLIP